jgi:hypothetical protein
LLLLMVGEASCLCGPSLLLLLLLLRVVWAHVPLLLLLLKSRWN